MLQAFKSANDTDYGLTAGVFTEDLARGKRVAGAIEAGMVHINDQPINDDPHMPFGGVKDSGLGRYNGEHIMDELTETKWISIQHEPREYSLQ